MKNRIAILISSSIAFVCISCIYSDQPEAKELYSDFHTPKVCISSVIDVNEGVRAMVSNTAAAKANVSTMLSLNTALVELYENGVVVDTLYPDFSSNKKTPFDFIGDYKTKASTNYTIKVKDAQYGKAEGSTTTPLNNYSLVVNSYTESILNNGTADYRKGKLNITINQTSISDEDYSIIITDEGEEAMFAIICTDNPNVFSNYASDTSNYNNTYRQIVSTSKLIGTTSTLTIDINATGEVQEGDLTDKLVLKVIKKNGDKVKYDASYVNATKAGQATGYGVNNSIYQNVSGGYGTVMAKYTKKITLIP